MADIFPTGFFGARNAFNSLGMQDPTEATAVVVGCGPVGLCALVSALEYKPKHLFAIDSVESRLELARDIGAEPLNFKTDPQGMMQRIKEVTEGRGADIVIEVVGLKPALRTAYEVVRPFGFISSIGVHNSDVTDTTTGLCYGASADFLYRCRLLPLMDTSLLNPVPYTQWHNINGNIAKISEFS
jgi:threonine dehydrogenase-like Zn-dependent dehydrogenase